jgi:hypothetical protein
MRHFLVVALLFIEAGTLFAQDYVAESSLSECKENGYYKFEVTPELSSWLSKDFSNLRVLNDSGVQIPYVIETGHDYITREYAEYRIVEKKNFAGCCTKVVIESPDGKKINNIYLRIRNADVHKTGSLSGSDDGKNWFALRDKFYFDGINGGDNVSELRLLDFPLSNYRFYQLSIDDSTSAPLNVLSVGYYSVVEKTASYVEIDPIDVAIVDSLKGKKTLIDLRFDMPHLIDRIIVKAEGPPLFVRQGILFSVDEHVNKKGDVEPTFEPLTEFAVSNDQPAVLKLPQIKAKHLRIVIRNYDNPPLKKYQVEVLQQRRYGIAWLEKGTKYSLFVGNETMSSPQYDLQILKNRLPVNMLSLGHGQVAAVRKKVTGKSEAAFQTAYLVWSGLAGIIIVLGVLSFRMIREARTSE